MSNQDTIYRDTKGIRIRDEVVERFRRKPYDCNTIRTHDGVLHKDIRRGVKTKQEVVACGN